MTFIDPAFEMAKNMKKWLEENDLLRRKKTHHLDIFTSGDPAYYGELCRRLKIQKPDSLSQKSL